MGSLTFVRTSDDTRVSFDSSPQYTLPKRYGWQPGSVRLEKMNENTDTIVWSVFARITKDDVDDKRVGTLFQKTKEAIWRAQK